MIHDSIFYRSAFYDMKESIRYYISEFSNTDSLSSAHDGLQFLMDMNIQSFKIKKNKEEID
jgi:hypothetical protein